MTLFRFTEASADKDTAAVFEEMKDGGPLTPGEDYGIKSMRDTLKGALAPIPSSFMPRSLTQASSANACLYSRLVAR